MRILTFCVFSVLVIFVSSAGLKEEFTWTRITYQWPGKGQRVRPHNHRTKRYGSGGSIVFEDPNLLNNGWNDAPEGIDYNHVNNIPMGANVWKNKLFITVPRRRLGVPSTLNYVPLDSPQKHNVPLIPYPNWNMNIYPDPKNSGENFVSIYRVGIDPCDRLWFVDTGLVEVLGNVSRVRPTTLGIIDLNTDKLIHTYNIPDSHIRPSSGLASITVDVTKDTCDDAYAYIPDLGGYGLIVYSLKEDNSWRITHNYFYLEPKAGEFYIAGHNFQWNDGIFSVELTDIKSNGFRDLYFHAMAGTHKYKVSTKVLRNQTLATRSYHENDFEEPESYVEAINSEEKLQWIKAMDCEIKALEDNNTWDLVTLPPGKRAIPNRWVFRVKTNADGTIEKYKARLVIKGYSQRKGVDYDQTFSPVARSSTIRTLLSVAANEGMKLMQIDVSTAFLYGDLKETIFMQQPDGCEDGSGRVCRLKKSLYGLKQAPRCWNEKFSNHLIKLGFKSSEADPCLFVRHTGNKKIFLVLYVDDGLIAANDEEELNSFINDLKREFKITSKPASFFLGLEIDRQEDGSVRVSQQHYAETILERFNMSNCKAVTTPIVKDNDTKESPQNTDFPYRQAVGALMFLMCGTRPDIAYAVSVVSRNLEKPTDRDVLKVKRILRYLRGTCSNGIIYKNNFRRGFLDCYSDADHGGDLGTARSTSGMLCLYSGAPVSWMSQRQTSVAISTTEAEVVAASEAAREIVWLKRLLTEMDQLDLKPNLQVDNEAAIRLAQNPEFHRRTKHIRIRHFFVRELVNADEISISKVDSEKQLADVFTKPLFSVRFQTLCNNMGICKIIK